MIMMAAAFGAPLLGAALVVISDSTGFRDEGRSGLSSNRRRGMEVDYQSGSKQRRSKGSAVQFR